MVIKNMKKKSEEYADWLDSDNNPLSFIIPENSITYKMLKEIEDANGQDNRK